MACSRTASPLLRLPAKVRTAIPAEDGPPLPDLIGRRFAAGRPDVAWMPVIKN